VVNDSGVTYDEKVGWIFKNLSDIKTRPTLQKHSSLQPSRWRQHIPLECQEISTKLHDITSQKTVFLIKTVHTSHCASVSVCI
jgi:hypothetical protein